MPIPGHRFSHPLTAFAQFLAFIQTICVTLAVNNGLGRHRLALSTSSYDTYSKVCSNFIMPNDSVANSLKYFYASELLLILSVAFAKASVTLLIVAIKPGEGVLRACYGVLAVVGLWAVSGFFALAFQCDLPRPWLSDPGRCINQQGLLDFIGAINILTDVAVIVLSFFLMRNVQVSSYKRFQVVGLFATRIM